MSASHPVRLPGRRRADRTRHAAAPGTPAVRTPAVRLIGVAKSYAGTVAVHPLDLTLQQGQTVALLGPNGAGKSTTIGMMLGIVRPDRGVADVAGRPPARAVAEGRIAGMLQDAGLMPGVRVAELVRLGERSYPHALPTARALELADLTDVARRRIDRLSGGQAQRLRFALAVVANPDILLLDEPTRALDVQGRAEFWNAMRDYAATGKTVVFATHYLDEVADNAQRVVMIAGGRIVADGSPADVRGAAGTSVVRFHAGATAYAAARRLATAPGVQTADTHGAHVTLTCTDADAAVRALVASDIDWSQLEVAPPDLEATFLRLTRRDSTPQRWPDGTSRHRPDGTSRPRPDGTSPRKTR